MGDGERRLRLSIMAWDLLDGQRPIRLVPASAATRAIIDRLVREDAARCDARDRVVRRIRDSL
jgi:hypothetical protein